jgi:hypothetical protein
MQRKRIPWSILFPGVLVYLFAGYLAVGLAYSWKVQQRPGETEVAILGSDKTKPDTANGDGGGSSKEKGPNGENPDPKAEGGSGGNPGRKVGDTRPMLPAPEDKNRLQKGMTGDVVLLVLDTRYFRLHQDMWRLGLKGMGQTGRDRLVGGKVFLLDQDKVRTWDLSAPAPPPVANPFRDYDFTSAFQGAFKTIASFEKEKYAAKAGFHAVVIWSSDQDPDHELGWANQIEKQTQKPIILLSQGSPYTNSKQLTDLFAGGVIYFQSALQGVGRSIEANLPN